MKLQGKLVLVIGSSRDIGESVAEPFPREGASVEDLIDHKSRFSDFITLYVVNI